jgi:hypothetical protein
LVNATGDDLDHFPTVRCKMTAKPELPGQHDLLAFKIDG